MKISDALRNASKMCTWLDERRRTDTSDATSTQKRTKTEWVGKNGLSKQNESPLTMNDMRGWLKQ